MPTSIAQFNNKVPLGTPKSAPVKFEMSVAGFTPNTLHIKVPAGPRGEVGFQITQGGAQVFPVNPGTYFVPENDEFEWPIDGLVTSGAWEMTAYNTGQYDHTIYVTFLMQPTVGAYEGQVGQVQTITGAQIPG